MLDPHADDRAAHRRAAPTDSGPHRRFRQGITAGRDCGIVVTAKERTGGRDRTEQSTDTPESAPAGRRRRARRARWRRSCGLRRRQRHDRPGAPRRPAPQPRPRRRRPAAATTAATTAPTTAASGGTTPAAWRRDRGRRPPRPARRRPRPRRALRPRRSPRRRRWRRTRTRPNSPSGTRWAASTARSVSNLVNQFNDSQTDIFVQDIYQGTYDDLLNKCRAGLQSAKDGPHLLQVYDIGQRFMIDSKAIEPMQTFIDADKFDLVAVRAADPQLLHGGQEAERDAVQHLQPDPLLQQERLQGRRSRPGEAAETWDDVAAAAKKLMKKDASGKAAARHRTSRSTAGSSSSGWRRRTPSMPTRTMAAARSGRRRSSTTAIAGVKILDWWKGMIDKGIAANLGRNTGDTQNAFAAGQVAITLDSTAALQGHPHQGRRQVRARHRLHAAPDDGWRAGRHHHGRRVRLHRQGQGGQGEAGRLEVRPVHRRSRSSRHSSTSAPATSRSARTPTTCRKSRRT